MSSGPAVLVQNPPGITGGGPGRDPVSGLVRRVLTRRGLLRLISPVALLGTAYSFEVASRAALADPAKAAAIKDYIRLINQAHAWADTHLQAWATVWGKATGLPYSVMFKAASGDTETGMPIIPAVVSSEQQIANDFFSAGLIPAKVDFANFSDTAFNSDVGGSS
jgi:sulfonate transport system substrate-binding protein